MTPCAMNWAGILIYGGVGIGHAVLLAVIVYMAIQEHREGNKDGLALMWWVMAFAEVILATVYISLAVGIITGKIDLCNRKTDTGVFIQGLPNVHEVAVPTTLSNRSQFEWNPNVNNPSRGAWIQDHEHNEESGFLSIAFWKQRPSCYFLNRNQHQLFTGLDVGRRAFIAGNIQERNAPCFSPGINFNRITWSPFINKPARVLDRVFAHVQKKEVKRFLAVANDAWIQLPGKHQAIGFQKNIRAVGELALLPVQISLSSQQGKLLARQIDASFHLETLPQCCARHYERRKGDAKVGYCAPIQVHTTSLAIQKGAGL